MKNKIKRTLLCLLAVSMMTVSANIYADNDDEESAAEVVDGEESSEGEAAEEKAAKLKESEEKVRADFADITEYLRKVGSADARTSRTLYGRKTAASPRKSPTTRTLRRSLPIR